jgi:hypothetical protein
MAPTIKIFQKHQDPLRHLSEIYSSAAVSPMRIFHHQELSAGGPNTVPLVKIFQQHDVQASFEDI